MTVEADGTNGTLLATGTFQEKKRTAASDYADAGPSETRNKTVIYHILDRSGSMDDNR